MALTTEEQRLVMRVENAAEIERLNALLAAENATMAQLVAAHRAGTVSQAAFEQQVKQATAGHTANTAALAALTRAQRDYRANLTALSYVANDFLSVSGGMQQRLNAIANNMPMLLMGFGALGPVLSGLLPLIGMIAANFDSIKKSLGFDAVSKALQTDLEQLKAKIKELEAKPVKLSVDRTELEMAHKQVDALTAGIQAFERFRKMTSGVQQESGQKVNKAIAEEGAADVTDRLSGSHSERSHHLKVGASL